MASDNRMEGGSASEETLEERDEHFLPPRRAVHARETEKWIRYFYRTLLVLFIMLVLGTLAWGTRYYFLHNS